MVRSLKMLSGERRRELYSLLSTYDTQELLLSEAAAFNILPFTAHVANFTLHDVGHSIRVIGYTNQIMKMIGNDNFVEEEVTALYIAGWLHDIGMISGTREKHAEISSKMLDKIEGSWIPLGAYLKPSKTIIEYHSSHLPEDFDLLKPHRMNGKSIDMKRLCAIFRLADESDITQDRAPQIVSDLLDDKFDASARTNWGANQSVKSLEYSPDENTITIITDDIEKSKFLIDKYRTEFEAMRYYIGGEFSTCTVQIQNPGGDYIQ